MSLKISEYTVEQTTIADTDKQELSTEISPSIWETRWYSITTLKATLKTYLDTFFVRWATDVEDTLTDSTDKVPSSHAVTSAIAGVGGVQSVTGTTVDNTDPLNPIVGVPSLQSVTYAGNSTTNQIYIASGADILVLDGAFIRHINGGDVTLIFESPTGSGTITFKDVPTGNETLAFLSDIPPSGAAAWGGITGTLSDQTDLQAALDAKLSKNTAITGATKTKVTYDANGLVTSGVDATTADIADSTNKRYVTDAQLTKVAAIDQSVSAAEKTTWNNKQNALGFTPEDTTNKVTTFTGNETSTTKFPVVKAILDYFTAANIRSILGITTLSGSNTGDNATNTTSNTYADGKVTDAIVDGVTTVAPSQNAVFDALATKQDTLVSGTNIKTINGTSILGSGDISIGSGSLISGTAIIDFGSENDWATLTVANATLTNANIKNFSILPTETSATSLDDFAINNVSFAIENIIDNTSFAIRGKAGNNASGNYTVKYLIQI